MNCEAHLGKMAQNGKNILLELEAIEKQLVEMKMKCIKIQCKIQNIDDEIVNISHQLETLIEQQNKVTTSNP